MTKQINYEEEVFDFEDLEMIEDEEEWCEPMGTFTDNRKIANGFEVQYLNNCNSKRSIFIPSSDAGTARDKFEVKFPSATFHSARMAYYSI